MSSSVWFEELCTGLIQEIYDSVTIKNENTGESDHLPREAIVVRKPEEDFKIETFPCVSIYVLDYKYDPVRYYPYPVVMDIDQESSRAILEDSAVPFNVTVQIDFWSEFQTDMDSMTRSWLFNHFKQFNLQVTDDGGTVRSCNCVMQGNLTKEDLVQNKRRMFHTIARYVIWVEIDENKRYTKPIVGEVEIIAQED